MKKIIAVIAVLLFLASFEAGAQRRHYRGRHYRTHRVHVRHHRPHARHHRMHARHHRTHVRHHRVHR